MPDYRRLTASEQRCIRELVFRGLEKIEPASYTQLMHRCGISSSVILDAAQDLEKRGAVTITRCSRGAPDLVSIVPRNKPAQ